MFFFEKKMLRSFPLKNCSLPLRNVLNKSLPVQKRFYEYNRKYDESRKQPEYESPYEGPIVNPNKSGVSRIY